MAYHSDQPLQCMQCGSFILPTDFECPRCGHPTESTQDVDPQPSMPDGPLNVWPDDTAIQREFTREFGILLQALPSGSCYSHPVRRVLMLGRNLNADLEDALDLTEINAAQHGVSRHHCLLQRTGTRLMVVDLDSTNGTILNDVRLTPHQAYPVADGDRLILGTLHLIVSFARSSML